MYTVNKADKIDQVSPMSLTLCVTVSVLECLNKKVDEADQLSPMTCKGCVSVSVMELALGGSATNRATSSSVY